MSEQKDPPPVIDKPWWQLVVRGTVYVPPSGGGGTPSGSSLRVGVVLVSDVDRVVKAQLGITTAVSFQYRMQRVQLWGKTPGSTASASVAVLASSCVLAPVKLAAGNQTPVFDPYWVKRDVGTGVSRAYLSYRWPQADKEILWTGDSVSPLLSWAASDDSIMHLTLLIRSTENAPTAFARLAGNLLTGQLSDDPLKEMNGTENGEDAPPETALTSRELSACCWQSLSTALAQHGT